MTRCHVLVRGRVQGVGFRWFVRERARALGLRGSVRNRADGSVEVSAEGDPGTIESLVADLREGPRGATVTGVDVLDPDPPDAILPFPFAIER